MFVKFLLRRALLQKLHEAELLANALKDLFIFNYHAFTEFELSSTSNFIRLDSSEGLGGIVTSNLYQNSLGPGKSGIVARVDCTQV